MGLKIKVYSQNAEAVGEMELSAKVFGVKVNPALVHQAVVTQLANRRKVIAHTKDRGEVRGGGRKPWRQKGTGRARAGSSRSPIWIGGGVTFGPRNERNFKMAINKKMKQKALLMALSDRVAGERLIVVDKLAMAEFKTKTFKKIVEKIADNSKRAAEEKLKPSILIIVEKKDDKLDYSARNLQGIELLNLNNINIVDLLKYKNLILTKSAVEKLAEKYK